MPARSRPAAAPASRRLPKKNVVPDALDLRDRPYQPAVGLRPAAEMAPRIALPLLDQGDTNACTGFALASVVHHLERQRRPRAEAVSPWMIYSMARRYDEFPGSSDTGSSLRGAMKGWHKHGVCRAGLWKDIAMPPAAKKASDDWWLEAATRPLGAYYRVETRSVTDMHVALNEVGILYASAICHAGWDEGWGKAPSAGRGRGSAAAARPPASRKAAPGGKRVATWTIPRVPAGPDDGGHAFAIVGYTREGFLVQNSWGPDWGSKGMAILSYEDWIENAMDCWVAQLGVATGQHRAIAGATSLRVEAGKVSLATDVVLRDREISPFIVNVENNGRLSRSGRFRTGPGDLGALFDVHLAEARRNWGLKAGDPVDVALYAHGGLVGEDDAAKTAATWIPALYDARIFPVFLIWETDLFSTLRNRLEDLITGQPRPTAGLGDQIKRFWNRRLERLLAGPGTAVWGEMKQNADAFSAAPESGGLLLHGAAMQSAAFAKSPVRLHLVGHSAGSILHSHIVDRLGARGWDFETMNLMAPAVTVELFRNTVLPRLQARGGKGRVRQLNQWHLGDAQEQADPTCKPILYYTRSLLYLVSESFEGGKRTPILGMEKYWNDSVGALKLPNARAWSAPGAESGSATHGGFDDDAATRASLIRILGSFAATAPR